MAEPDDHLPLATVWRRFRLGGELRPLVCLAATVAAGLVLAGVGLAAAYARGLARPNALAPQSLIIGDVRPRDLVVGLIGAAFVWLLLLAWIWRPAVRLDRNSWSPERRRRWGRPIAITVFIGAGLTVLSYVILRRPWDDSHQLVTAASLVAAGVSVVFWLPAIVDLERGRPVTGRDGRVNVACPQCGYSMAGLREAACPECGAEYTLDGLILEQGYAAPRERSDG
jgi:hypothetical protein